MFRCNPRAIWLFALLMTPASALGQIPANYPVITGAQPQNEVLVRHSPTDSGVLVAACRDFQLGYRRLGVAYTHDGGGSWTSWLFPTPYHPWQTDPVLSVDAEGRFYLCMMDLDPPVPPYEGKQCELVFCVSTDGGVDWETRGRVGGRLGVDFEDKPWVAIDRTGGAHHGNVYVAWARFDWPVAEPGRIMFARSADGAYSFGDTLVMASPFDFSQCGLSVIESSAGEWSLPLVDAEGSVYVFWVGPVLDTATCRVDWVVRMRKSVDGGVSFAPTADVFPVYGNWGYVSGGAAYGGNILTGTTDISGGPFDGNIYVATATTAAEDPYGSDYDVMLFRSNDGGVSWDEPVRVNDDVDPTGEISQFHPQLTCNAEGTLAMVYYDQLTDTANHMKFDVFAAYSFDGGATISTSHRISEVSVDPAIMNTVSSSAWLDEYSATAALNPNAAPFAEYIGVAMYDQAVHAVWTDTRNATQDIYGADWEIPLLEPRLLEPLDGDTVLGDPEFRWAAAWDVSDDRYRLEVALDSLFGALLWSGYADSNLVALLSMPETTLYWRVKAFMIGTGDSSDYSGVRRVQISRCQDSDGDGYGDPGVPENVCPADNCAWDFNPTQEDVDGDGFGDVCDRCVAVATSENVSMLTGDTNTDGVLTAADIIYLVGYVFKGGPAPMPAAESGDVDCSHAVTSADIIRLVGYVFKNADPPCDRCSLFY